MYASDMLTSMCQVHIHAEVEYGSWCTISRYIQMLVEKLIAHIRDHGVVATARRATAAAWRASVSRVYRSHVEVILDRDFSRPAPNIENHSLLVRELTAEDVEAVQECIRTHNVRPQDCANRLVFNVSHGYRALVGLLDGKVVAYGWLVGQEQEHPAKHLYDIQVCANELYACDLFVAPRFRKNNMALEFLVRAELIGRKVGIKRIIAAIRDSNRRSLWVHHQAGYREIGRLRVHTLFNYLLVSGRRVAIRNDLWF